MRLTAKLAGVLNSPCRCCITRPAVRAGKLCKQCYHTPGVRETFPPLIACGPRPSTNPTSSASVVTDARPGSDAKIEVMRRRVEAGEHLHHPDDFRP